MTIVARQGAEAKDAMLRHRHAASRRWARALPACAALIAGTIVAGAAGIPSAHAQSEAVTIHLNRLDGWIAGSATAATAWCLTVSPDWATDAEPVNESRNPDQTLTRAFCLYDLPLEGEAQDRQLRRDSDDGRLFLVPADEPFAENLVTWFADMQALDLSADAAGTLESLLLRTLLPDDPRAAIAPGDVTRRDQPVEVQILGEPLVLTEVVVPIVVDSPFAFQRAAHIVIAAAAYYDRLIQTRDAHRDLVADVRDLSDGMRNLVQTAWSVQREMAGGEAPQSTAGQPDGVEVDDGASTALLGATDVVDGLSAGLHDVQQTLEAIREEATTPVPPAPVVEPTEPAETVEIVESPQPSSSWHWAAFFGVAGVLSGGALVLGFQALRRPAAGAAAGDETARKLALAGPKAAPLDATDAPADPGWVEPEWHDAPEDEAASEPLITEPPPRETWDQYQAGTEDRDGVPAEANEGRETQDVPTYDDAQWEHLDEIDRRVRVARMQAAFVASQVFSSIDAEMPADEESLTSSHQPAANGNAQKQRGDEEAQAPDPPREVSVTPRAPMSEDAAEEDSLMWPIPPNWGNDARAGPQQTGGPEAGQDEQPRDVGGSRPTEDPTPVMGPPVPRNTAGELDDSGGGGGVEVSSQALTRDILNSVARIIEEIGNYRLKTGEEPAKMFAALAGILGEKGQAAALRHDAESYRANAESLNEEIRLTQMMLQQIGKEINGAIRLPEAVERHVIPEFEKLKHQCEVLQQELEALRREEPLARRG